MWITNNFCVTNKYFFVNTVYIVYIHYVYYLLNMVSALTLVLFEIYIIVIVEICVVLKVILKINVIFVWRWKTLNDELLVIMNIIISGWRHYLSHRYINVICHSWIRFSRDSMKGRIRNTTHYTHHKYSWVM